MKAVPDSHALIHLTSLLVQVTPSGRDAVLTSTQLSGVSLHATAAPSKLVAMLESADERAAAAAADALLKIPGVLTVSIVSHLTESAAVLDAEMGP
jgi:nitrate reductase NapAB chaperone NapD